MLDFLSNLNVFKGKTTEEVTYAELVKNASNFEKDIVKFPIKTNSIEAYAGKSEEKQKKIEEYANNTYILASTEVVELIDKFLKFKLEFGSDVEKRLYTKMSIKQFVDRIIKKRPCAFLNPTDDALLPGGEKGLPGGFDEIGTANEKKPLILKDFISYDEMLISALCGISSPTYFINNGNRQNGGIPENNEDLYEKYGIYVGHVGARFERKERMEWLHVMITEKQNTKDKGYGKSANPQSKEFKALGMFAKLYWKENNYFPSHDEINDLMLDEKSKRVSKENQEKYKDKYLVLVEHEGLHISLGDYTTKLTTQEKESPPTYAYYNVEAYKVRMKIVIQAFLREANQRAKDAKTTAYVHAVGLGTGAWAIGAIAKEQEQYIVDVYREVLVSESFEHISDIDFSWFKTLDVMKKLSNEVKEVTQEYDGLSGKCTLHYSERNPADILSGEHAKKLLVADYAWDSNALVNNEFWWNMLKATGDPAAGCCSATPYLQNHYINPRVSGAFAKLATPVGVMSLVSDRAVVEKTFVMQMIQSEIDILPMRLMLEADKPKNCLNRVSQVITALSSIEKLHPEIEEKVVEHKNKLNNLRQELGKKQEAVSVISFVVPLFQQHKGARVGIAASLSLLLPGGNDERFAKEGKQIPSIDFTNINELRIRFPKYRSPYGEYGERIHNALKACDFKALEYKEESHTSKFGQYVSTLIIKDADEMEKLVDALGGKGTFNDIRRAEGIEEINLPKSKDSSINLNK